MAVTAAQVKELREKTSVGMMDCKKALEETGGDMAAAVKLLREKGELKAEKRAGRTAAEGLAAVAVADDFSAGAVIELNSETDFVARNEEFAALAQNIANAALASKANSVDAVNGVSLGETDVQTAVSDIRGKIGEKIELSNCGYLGADVVAGYIHPPGKIGVLVGASAPGISADKKAELSNSLRNIAMHIAASGPRFLNSSEVDQSTLDAEAEIFANIARNEGKPENIIPKIVEGKIKSFYKDYCLVDQGFAMDPKKSVAQAATEYGKEVGVDVTLVGFHCFVVGAKAEG